MSYLYSMRQGVKQTRRRGYTRVSSKNQITIPAAALAAAGLTAGDRLRVVPDGHGRLVVERERDALDDVAGIFDGLYPPGYLDDLRDEWR